MQVASGTNLLELIFLSLIPDAVSVAENFQRSKKPIPIDRFCFADDWGIQRPVYRWLTRMLRPYHPCQTWLHSMWLCTRGRQLLNDHD